MTVWFASVSDCCDYLTSGHWLSKKSIQVFPEKDFLLRRIFFPEDFLWRRFSLEKILYPEDFNFSGKDFNFFQENFNFFWEDFLSRRFVIFALCKSKTEDIICRSLAVLHEYFDFFREDFDFFQENFDFFREDFSNLLLAKAKLRACYAAASA